MAQLGRSRKGWPQKSIIISDSGPLMTVSNMSETEDRICDGRSSNTGSTVVNHQHCTE